MITLADAFESVHVGIFPNLDDLPEQLVEDPQRSLSGILTLLATDEYMTNKTAEERIDFAQKLIAKIGTFSSREEDHYDALAGIINCNAQGADSVAVRILKEMIKNNKFDAGAAFHHEETGERKDALEVASQQSVGGHLKALTTMTREERQEFVKTKFREPLRPKDHANKEFVLSLLDTGRVAGFEGNLGIETSSKIRSGEIDFRSLAGRAIPSRNLESMESPKVSTDPQNDFPSEVVIKESGSLFSGFVAAISSLLHSGQGPESSKRR